ncbi:hypothetical protein DPMN_011366 [Dreissena polymorpha]|uniref:Uncharacterized protein n=1 Tax=Dreissena polymorpha TaxID=45954 RepID=A0A9D4N3X4_DREPO|nr:hypothetical protein DPMN_011366 [Dreissena polymorpha]
MSDIVPFTGTAASADLKNVTDGVAVGVDYTLNLKKSMQKKLDSTDQEDVIIYEKGGGFRLLLNTSMYFSRLRPIHFSPITHFSINAAKFRCTTDREILLKRKTNTYNYFL